MIASLDGKVTLIKNNYILLEVGGVGYKVSVGTIALELKEGQGLFVYTHQAVRENALDLFGFKTYTEFEVFELLISVSGIGPKVALSVLAVSTPASLKRAVISENTDELTKVSGIGKKVASKIILELKNKIEKIDIGLDDDKDFDLEIYETLEALGFDRSSIREALKDITASDTEGKIKQALKILGK